MASNRRDFLKLSGMTGVGWVGSGWIGGKENNQVPTAGSKDNGQNPSHFNMCGYAAPALETVRIGFIGLGNRGPDAVARMKLIQGTAIVGLCDIRTEKVNAVRKSLEGSIHNPDIYTGNADEWKKL